MLTNTTNDEQFYKAGEIVGFFQLVPEEDILEQGLPEARIDEVFSDFSREPKENVPGACSKELTEEERKFLEDNLVINAPYEFKSQYRELMFSYHDLCSKSKFDIGQTDVIEHKVVLNYESPIHIRQFRILFEHRDTIYSWVDELLGKGAIEVSQSCFNSPIFLVPKLMDMA